VARIEKLISIWLLVAAGGLSGGWTPASIVPGHGAKIALQAAQNVVSHTGCLLAKDGHFIQQDEETQQVFEIRGPDLKANVGNRVLTTGRVAAARPAIQMATAVIDVNTVSPRSQGGCLSVASSLEAQANP
jgi:hypothetical protein